jgi:enoyl-CoA hydratase
MNAENKAPPSVLIDTIHEHVSLVTIARPEAMNAVSARVARELERIVISTEADPDIWAVILTGAGDRAFCAGADLKEVAAGGLSNLWTEASGFAGFVNARRTKVWIAAVEGMALAGGFELALACDLIVASEEAAFGLPEVTRGMLAAAGGAYRLMRALPRAVAIELIATGDRLSAERAHALNLVSSLARKGGAVQVASQLAQRICRNAPIAVRESLAIARQAFDLDDATLSRYSSEAQARLMQTEDFVEGPRAFVEKRPPKWRGR